MVRLARVVAVAALVAAGSLLTVSPASAAVTDVKCDPPSSSTIVFNPPLTLVNQLTTVTQRNTYKPCASATAPAVVSGSMARTFNMFDDCTMVMQPGNVTFTITWNTGQISTITATRTPQLVGNTLVVDFVGRVTAGLFLNSLVRQQYVGDGTNLIACLNGVGQVSILTSRLSLLIYH